MTTRSTQETKIPPEELEFMANGQPITYEELQVRVSGMFGAILERLTLDLKLWVSKNVPERTGQLKETILDILGTSTFDEKGIKIELGTLLEYGADVDAMTTSQVRHFGEWGYAYYTKKKGKIWLNDITAIGEWWQKYKEYATERYHYQYIIALDEFMSGIGRGKIKRTMGKLIS